MITATQIRVGNVLIVDGELYKVTWTQHVTPGKGVACMQTKLKNIINGKNLEKRFRSSDKVETADIRSKKMQYLYQEKDDYIFMDSESYEQLPLSKGLLEDAVEFLTEGDEYTISCYEENPIGIELPKTMDFKVTVAPPEIKKATATSSLRPVTIENGMTIQAPSFIKEDDVIRINTETREYLERVKN